MSIDEVISFMKTNKGHFTLQGQDGRSIFDVEPIRSIIDAIQDGIYITDANAITIAAPTTFLIDDFSAGTSTAPTLFSTASM